MLPIIFGSAALALIYKVKPACSVCGSKLGWNQNCLIDDKPVCGGCGVEYELVIYNGRQIIPEGRCCAQHKSNLETIVRNGRKVIDEEKRIRSTANTVITYSSNFRGKTPQPSLGKQIQTDWFPTKQDAAFNLKFIAASLDCFSITEEHFDTKSDGDPENINHIITWFRYSGMI